MKHALYLIFITLFLTSCKKEINCNDSEIRLAFITNTISDIDTFVIRKYKENDNFQTLVDTTLITMNSSISFQTSNDTTSFQLAQQEKQLKPGYDWKVFIPAKNRLVSISNIHSEKATTECGTLGEPIGCACTNRIFSFKQDNQIKTYSESYVVNYIAFITL